jgi:hypothetical protein
VGGASGEDWKHIQRRHARTHSSRFSVSTARVPVDGKVKPAYSFWILALALLGGGGGGGGLGGEWWWGVEVD